MSGDKSDRFGRDASEQKEKPKIKREDTPDNVFADLLANGAKGTSSPLLKFKNKPIISDANKSDDEKKQAKPSLQKRPALRDIKNPGSELRR